MSPLSSSTTPTPKVVSAGVAGAATVLLVWLVSLAGVDVPPEAAAAVTTLLAVVAAYSTRDRSSPGAHLPP